MPKKENFPSNEQKDGMYYAKGKGRRMGWRQKSVFHILHNKECMQLTQIQWDPTAVLNVCWKALFCYSVCCIKTER